MSNFFEHKTEKNKFIIFSILKGKKTPIKFYFQLDPYSGSISPSGGRYPDKIESTHIDFCQNIEKAKFDSVSDLISWHKNSKKEFIEFLEKNNLTIEDIKLLEIKSEKPTEKEVSIDFDILLNYC